MSRFRGVVAVALTLSFPSLGLSLTVEEVLSRLAIEETRTKTLKFDYEQETRFSNDGPRAVAKGTAWLQKPAKIRLQQTAPDARWTISNGQKTWVYNPAEKQAWISKNGKLGPAANLKVFPFENIAQTLRNNYSLSIVSESTGPVGLVRLGAVPKDPSDEAKLEMDVSTDDWIPRSTRVRTPAADVNTIITNVDVQPVLTGQEFNFVPPSGTEILSF